MTRLLLTPPQNRIKEEGAERAFSSLLPFDELATIQGIKSYLGRTMGFEHVHVESAEEAMANLEQYEGKDGFDQKTVGNAEPGLPSFAFYNTQQ